MSIISDIVGTAITPIKGYLMAGTAALALGAFGWYTVHERNVEHAKDIAAEQRVALVAKAKDAKIEQLEDAALVPIENTYHAKIDAAPVADTGLVCHNPVRPSVVPQAADNRPGAPSVPNSTEGPGFDPSGAISTRGRDADAQIVALQGVVKTLVDAMNAANKK
jgi:hypothetical protein